MGLSKNRRFLKRDPKKSHPREIFGKKWGKKGRVLKSPRNLGFKIF